MSRPYVRSAPELLHGLSIHPSYLKELLDSGLAVEYLGVPPVPSTFGLKPDVRRQMRGLSQVQVYVLDDSAKKGEKKQ